MEYLLITATKSLNFTKILIIWLMRSGPDIKFLIMDTPLHSAIQSNMTHTLPGLLG